MLHTQANLSESMKKRQEAYAAELQRQEVMEAKRKEFAAAVDDFLAFLAAERNVRDFFLLSPPHP